MGKKCAYFKFDKFFNFLKSKEWRIRADKTAWMIVNVENIKGSFVRKRFPKKDKEKNPYEALDVICVLQSIFDEKEIEDEVIILKDKKELI